MKKKLQKNEKKSCKKMKKKALKSRNKSTEWKEKSIDSQKTSFARHFVFLYAWRPCNNLKDLHYEISG